jgi:hypothetical protein
MALPLAVHQRVLAHGAESALVARTFMTAGELFDCTYLGQPFQADRGKKFALELAKRLATLDGVMSNGSSDRSTR